MSRTDSRASSGRCIKTNQYNPIDQTATTTLIEQRGGGGSDNKYNNKYTKQFEKFNNLYTIMPNKRRDNMRKIIKILRSKICR